MIPRSRREASQRPETWVLNREGDGGLALSSAKLGKWLGFRPVALGGRVWGYKLWIWERANREIGCMSRGGRIWGLATCE